MNIIFWLVIGGLIGWVASMVMRTDGQQGILLNVVVGIVGSVLGGWFLSPIVGVSTINQSNFSVAGLPELADTVDRVLSRDDEATPKAAGTSMQLDDEAAIRAARAEEVVRSSEPSTPVLLAFAAIYYGFWNMPVPSCSMPSCRRTTLTTPCLRVALKVRAASDRCRCRLLRSVSGRPSARSSASGIVGVTAY